MWRVFAIMLEYCCKSNYQMMISKLNEEHKDAIDQMERDFTEHIQKLTDNEKHLKEALDELSKKKEELEKQKQEEEFLRKKIEEEFNKKVETHEEEVQLRLKFEQKLNNMHALHRDLQSKYQRALEDIYQLETSNAHLNKLASDQKTELISLRSDKVENESKILYQSERIKQLILETELKLRQANDLELKLNKANAELEQKSLQLKNFEKEANEQRLKLEANQALIDGLTSDKYHLELSLKEANDQRIQYRDKSERLQKLNEDTFNEMQEYKMQLVGVQEIKKDRDDRLDKLRSELDEIGKKYDLLEREHTVMKVNY
jgi:DNA repair protein SbcC/Rad50